MGQGHSDFIKFAIVDSKPKAFILFFDKHNGTVPYTVGRFYNALFKHFIDMFLRFVPKVWGLTIKW